ncbi:nucleotidyltransferase domain-containing protein [bacterium]|nr:nucleotidyltransferase domain-containing protein [bacterium]
MDAAVVIENVVNAYKPLPGVKAIALFGSRAKDTASISSDINLMVVESNSPTQSTRAQVLSQLCDHTQPSSCRDIPIPADAFHVNGYLVSIWHIDENLICERIASVVKGRRLENSVIVAILHESSILWDPRRQLQAWKTSINPIPESYIHSVLPVLFSEISYILESLSTTSISSTFFYHHELMAALTSLYEIVFLSNGFYLTLNHRVNKELEILKYLPTDFIKHVDSILLLDSDPKGLLAKHRRICLLTQLVGKFLETKNNYKLKAGWGQLKRAAPFLFEFSD